MEAAAQGNSALISNEVIDAYGLGGDIVSEDEDPSSERGRRRATRNRQREEAKLHTVQMHQGMGSQEDVCNESADTVGPQKQKKHKRSIVTAPGLVGAQAI